MAAAEPTTVDRQTAADAAARRLVRRVLAQWWLIVACALVACVAGYLVSSSRTKIYEATTSVLLNEVDLTALVLQSSIQQQGQDAETKAATNARLVMIPRVRQAASMALGGSPTAAELNEVVTVTTEPNTLLVDISARDADPQRSAHIANAMRSAFIKQRQQVTVGQLEGTRQQVAQQLNGLPQARVNTPAGEQLASKLDQLDTLILTAGAGVRTAQEAEVPTVPASPKPRRDAVLALIVGGLLGLGVAVIRARRDDHVREVDELEEIWDLPRVGLVPQSKDLAGREAGLPHGQILEAFALARTNLRYLHVGGEVKTLVVTSALPSEGKSTVTWNLALASAMSGARVLVIDADLRRPTIAARLGLTDARGFSEVLAGVASFSETVQAVTVDAPGGGNPITLDVLSAGFVPPNPLALLERDVVADLLSRISDDYDVILLDTPPATAVADAKILLTHADGALVVTRVGLVTRDAFERLRDLLSGTDNPVLGMIVNGVASPGGAYGGYYSTEPGRADES